MQSRQPTFARTFNLQNTLARVATGVMAKLQAHGAIAIVALSYLAYGPILGGTFLMDDERLIHLENPLVNGQLTVGSIWFQTDFPLSTMAMWLEWLAFGNHPFFYHVIGIALHGAGGILLWRLLGRLQIRGAWVAGAIFALHPVCVNSVARIAEIKNTLSLPFFLLSAIFYLKYEALVLHPRNPSEKQRHAAGTFFYAIAVMTFVLALLSKTSTVMLPFILLICAAWQRSKVTRHDLVHTIPFFALAAGFGLLSVWFQKYQALAGETLPAAAFLERTTLAARVFWFYLGKAFFPLNLNLAYPEWKIAFPSLAAFIPCICIIIAAGVCWRFWRTWGRPVIFGLGCFVVALFPALGFFDAQFLTKWKVSDHLQYLPIICVIALVAGSIVSRIKVGLCNALVTGLLLFLLILSSQRARVFTSEERLMRDSLAKNPAASEAHNDLGVLLAKQNKLSEALVHFVSAVQSNPNNIPARLNLGQALAIQRNLPEAELNIRAVLEIKPFNADARAALANILLSEGKGREACKHLIVALRFKPTAEMHLRLAEAFYNLRLYSKAVAESREALKAEPDATDALNNLAWVLATCPDARVRDGHEAVHHAQRACDLTGFAQSRYISTLAAAYAEARRFPEAVTTVGTAVKLQNASGETQFAEINKQLLALYQAGRPYHEPAPEQ